MVVFFLIYSKHDRELVFGAVSAPQAERVVRAKTRGEDPPSEQDAGQTKHAFVPG